MLTATRSRLVGLLLMACWATLAQAELTTLTLHHRPAEQLLPVIKPLIRQGDYLAGQNDKIFLRTDPATLQAVRQIVQELDRQPVTLRITVKQGQRLERESDQLTARIRLNHGDGRVVVGGSQRNSNGATLSAGGQSAGGYGSISANSQTTADRDNSEQQLVVAEGYEALFYLSDQVPVVNYQQGVFGQLHPQVSYRSAVTGFSVIAELSGDQVRLHIHPQKQQFSGRDTISGQQLDTTLVTKLGEWQQIGAFNNDDSRSERGLLARTHRRQNQQQSIMIKVERVDETE